MRKRCIHFLALSAGAILGISQTEALELYQGPVLVSHNLEEYTTPACIMMELDASNYIENPEAVFDRTKDLKMRGDVEMMAKADVPKGYRPNRRCVNAKGFEH
ncbi:hypothetical protein SAMN04488056_112143 [Cohaesibacter marisflavi]|uniref:Uncharacterized protein n=1 Tax=Cohaesibacter marisflavi TaxID=655353 RepID=A0A1I5JWX9_9HYPH|nr:hypothetical protein [Cohaesibacter marisflavi]SFO77312.1 hypothetical protein SAMN04488056_112143 [Cohaesibacter marisflavi]